MRRTVLKFGGTSMQSDSTRAMVADRIAHTQEFFDEVIVVVSAIGRMGTPYATDTLLNLFAHGHPLPNSREQDMLYACAEIISGTVLSNQLSQLKIKNIFLSGAQAGIQTDEHYSYAKIINIDTTKIEGCLKQGYVVIVAGSQGISASDNITSLGRGGSDTTACALAYYLKADELDIYTDVNGIYTADPNLVHRAKQIPYMSYEQCQRLADYGAKVIHPRAVEFAKLCPETVFRILSLFEAGKGSCIGNYNYEGTSISGIRNTQQAASPDEKYKNMLDYLKSKSKALSNSDKSVSSAIFIIGSNARLEVINDILKPIFRDYAVQISSETVAIGVEPCSYEQELNRLHDTLCLP